VQLPKVRAALKKLNPELAGDTTNLAVEELTRDRRAMSLLQANFSRWQRTVGEVV